MRSPSPNSRKQQGQTRKGPSEAENVQKNQGKVDRTHSAVVAGKIPRCYRLLLYAVVFENFMSHVTRLRSRIMQKETRINVEHLTGI